MSTSLLYHAFGIREYKYKNTKYEGGSVHSYYPVPVSEKAIVGTTTHGIAFASILEQDNIIATQFHPEKSGRPGLEFLKNFCGT
jgi:glutamine amidotransferase